jgi:hypothetical protein
MHLVENALTDAPGRGRNSEISNEEKPGLWMRPAATWVMDAACRNVGYGCSLLETG